MRSLVGLQVSISVILHVCRVSGLTGVRGHHVGFKLTRVYLLESLFVEA
jgi:hypothetical protein